MLDLLSVIGETSIQRYEWRSSISYRKGELCTQGRNVYLNLVEGNVNNHPLFSHLWQCIGRVNELDINTEEWSEGDYLTATDNGVTEYLTCLTVDGLKRIKCQLI